MFKLLNYNCSSTTVHGKITVIRLRLKLSLNPKITHLLLTLTKPCEYSLKTLENAFFKFVWNSKNDRIARNKTILDHDSGGFRMSHLPTLIKALKLTWIRKLHCNT